MIQMGTQAASEYAAQNNHRSDQHKQHNQTTTATFHLNATGAHSMQSQAHQQQYYDERRSSFGQMAPLQQTAAVQQANMTAPATQMQIHGHAPADRHQYQYQANVQANQYMLTVAPNTAPNSVQPPSGLTQQQPLVQAPGYQQYQPVQQQQQQQHQYSSNVNYPVQSAQHEHQQWSSTSPPLVYPVTTQAGSNQQYCNELAQVAPPDCPPYGACQPSSPMSTQSPSPEAATSILQTPMTPPMTVGQSGACGTAGSSSGQSSSCGRIASPSGASSTISSSESVGNMSINLEQYISKRNERERSRVRNVNDAFDNLKNSLPLEMEKLSKRMSKVEILRTAISYIKNLEEVLGYKQQQARDDRAMLQQQHHCAGGQAASMIRKRPRSGSVGHLIRSSLNQKRLLHERTLDCENSMRLAWRYERPGPSLSRHDLLMLDDDFKNGAASGYLKRKLDFNEKSDHQPKEQHERAAMMHEVPTSCRQDTFRLEQARVQNYRRRQEQQHQDQCMQHSHQSDHEMSDSAGQTTGGLVEFNTNVRCYNERNFDNY